MNFEKKLLISIFFLFFITFSNSGFAIDVSDCITISSSGEYYLVNNINTSKSVCFDIKANDVIFDCQGNTISHQAQGISAFIISSNLRNVTIKNCILYSWFMYIINNALDTNVFNTTFYGKESYLSYGFYYKNNASVENSRFYNLMYAIISEPIGTPYVIIKDSEFKNNYYDFYLSSTNLILINVSAPYTYVYADEISKLIRMWYINLTINAKTTPNVIIRDSKNTIQYNKNTRNPNLIAIEYIASCETPMCVNTGEVRDYYTPYTLELKAPYHKTLETSNYLTNNWLDSYTIYPITIVSEIPILALLFVIIPSGVILIILRKLFSEFSIANVIAILIIVVLMVVLLGILISIPAI